MGVGSASLIISDKKLYKILFLITHKTMALPKPKVTNQAAPNSASALQ